MKVKSLKRGIISQFELPFRDSTAQERKEASSRAADQWIRWKYPITDDEKRWLPADVRLARFVSFIECDICPLECVDHTENGRWPGSICLKDLETKEGKNE